HVLLRLAAPGRGADRAPALSGGAPGTPQRGRREHEVGGGALPARPPRRRHLRHDGDPAAVHRLALARAARAARGEPRAARGREGAPHRRPGERPDAAACGVAKAAVAAEELLAHCRARLSSYKVPRHLWLRRKDELPEKPSGKVDKAALRAEAARLVRAGGDRPATPPARRG